MSVMTQKKYIGEFSNNVPHGYGTMIYESGSKFVGFFQNGQRQGLGMEVAAGSEGQPRVNKGIFEGMQRIGPNWAANSTLELMKHQSAYSPDELNPAPKKEQHVITERELMRMRIQATLGQDVLGQDGAKLMSSNYPADEAGSLRSATTLAYRGSSAHHEPEKHKKTSVILSAASNLDDSEGEQASIGHD
jgi:hypothetical protein